MDKGMEGDLPLNYRTKYWLRYGYLGTLNACDQWPIDLTLKIDFIWCFSQNLWNDCHQSFRSIYLLVWNWAPLGKMINFGSFAQRNALDQWSNDPSLDRADQWSDESLSRVDLIDHWSENRFARKERHRSEILIRILLKERTLCQIPFLTGFWWCFEMALLLKRWFRGYIPLK